MNNEKKNSAEGKDFESLTARVSGESVAIPFGRYGRAPEGGPETEEAFIGREGERAFLIGALTNAGNQAAYLVTG